MPKNHRRAIISRLRSQPWAITADALSGIAELLQSYDPNQELTAEEISARLGIGERGRSKMQTIGDAAVIPLFGVLQPKENAITRWLGGTATESFLADFDEALGAEQVKRIVFLVDSPGGAAMGNEEAAAYIRSKRDQKELLTFAEGLMGSAAYYIGSAASKVYASPSSAVGSIGTIAFHQDASAFWAEWGLKWTPIFFGKHKADGNTVQPLSAQGRATIQEFVDAFGKQFAGGVALNRNVTIEQVMERFGQGKVFLADEAQERGLIDGVAQSLDDVLAQRAKGSDAGNRNVIFTLSSANPAGSSTLADKNAYAAAAANSSHSKTEDDDMTKRVKAALYALGLIDSIDADDAVCTAALKGFCAARSLQYDSEAKEAAILALLSRPAADNAAGSQEGRQNDGQSDAAADNVQKAHDREIEEAKKEAAKNERKRQAEIKASAKLLGMDEKVVEEAIESGKSHADIISEWHQKLAEAEEGVSPVPIRQTECSIDTFNAAACDALFSRAAEPSNRPELSQLAEQLSHRPLMFFAEETLRLHGRTVNAYATPEDTALRFLQLDGGVRVFSAMGPATNRPGDFPNLLSALAGKMLDQALELAQPTYPSWTARMGDVPDFKPKTIIGVGRFDELDLILDDADVTERQLEEEFQGWIQADRYSNAVGLTPVMVANDDLDGFTEGIMSLGDAHEMTLNRLCLALITGNVTLVDGNSLYDATNHLNEVASGSGGAPSLTQMNLQREAHRSQTGIGGKGKVRTPPAIALVPTTLETEAEQLFMPFSVFGESKVPITDATLNVYRGKILPVVEPELDDASTTMWYTFCNPRRRRSIVHTFMRGYGRGGRRTTWFEPSRETRYVKLEGRFGAAVASFRGTVRNYGA